MYPDLPSCFFGAVSQSYLRCCLSGCISHFAPNKTSIATLTLCFFFFLSWHRWPLAGVQVWKEDWRWKSSHLLSLVTLIFVMVISPSGMFFSQLMACLVPSQLLKKERKESEVAQSCLTLCNPMDCSLPGFSVYGIFQARVLEWVAISFLRGSSWPRDWTQVSCIAGKTLYPLSYQGSPLNPLSHQGSPLNF